MSTLPVKTLVRQRSTPMLLQTLQAQKLRESFVVDPLMKLSEIAPMLGNPSYGLLRRWIVDGSLRVWRVGPRGHMRVKLSEVKRFRDEHMKVTP